MSYEFKLPDIGEGIHEAELLEWRVKVGDLIKDGQDIATLNTDKVTVELPSPCAGKILSLHGTPGDVLIVGSVIAVLETTNKVLGQPSANQRALEAMHGAPTHRPGAPMPTASRVSAAAPASGTNADKAYGHVVNATVIAGPSTRKMARTLDVDLKRLPGSGPSGRILRSDVEAAAHARSAHASVEARAALSGARRVKLTGPRANSARNLHESVQRTVTTTTTFEVMGDGIKALLKKLTPMAEKRGLKLSPLHLIAKCCAAALSRHERFNATIDEETSELILHDSVDLSIAVAAGDRLVVPVVRGVERKLLLDFVADLTSIAQRAKDGKLAVADFKGGTFTVSSTGGLERATIISTRPILNPPQTGILWCSRIQDRPRVQAGELCAGPMMNCSLSFDHRYIDGAEATVFINDLAEYLEQPELALA
jgi:pyruvate/2-oxoglutarate dehydrogenase complex dihydrolipoamide acyltransferase (E2) component